MPNLFSSLYCFYCVYTVNWTLLCCLHSSMQSDAITFAFYLCQKYRLAEKDKNTNIDCLKLGKIIFAMMVVNLLVFLSHFFIKRVISNFLQLKWFRPQSENCLVRVTRPPHVEKKNLIFPGTKKWLFNKTSQSFKKLFFNFQLQKNISRRKTTPDIQIIVFFITFSVVYSFLIIFCIEFLKKTFSLPYL